MIVEVNNKRIYYLPTYNLHVSSTSSNSKNDCLELAILKITGKISLVIYKSVISKKTEHYTFDISPEGPKGFAVPVHTYYIPKDICTTT